jgi:hypothetical protein
MSNEIVMENESETNALDTGLYEVTTYRCGQQTKAVCIVDQPQGDWWYALNDGLLDVGPFASEQTALDAAVKSLNLYRDVMGGKVDQIVHRRMH